jgi:hypothetical protein
MVLLGPGLRAAAHNLAYSRYLLQPGIVYCYITLPVAGCAGGAWAVIQYWGVSVTTNTIGETQHDVTEAEIAEAQVLAFERRRAGRQDVSPALVPMLRAPGTGMAVPNNDTQYRDYVEADPFRDPMAPARGIALGLGVSMLFWGAVGYAVFR